MAASRKAMARVERAFLATGQASVLDRLGDVRRPHCRAAGEVGDGAGDLENAVPGARREIQPLAGLLEQAGTGRIRRAMGFDLGGRQPGIRFVLAFALGSFVINIEQSFYYRFVIFSVYCCLMLCCELFINFSPFIFLTI